MGEDAAMSPEHWRMRAAVVGWLRYERGCFLVCWERSPFGEHHYRPDVVGVEKRWRLVEVEVKHSLADFKANGSKRGLRMAWQFPWQFWFAVPSALAPKVRPLLPDGAGLLALAEQDGKYRPRLDKVVQAASVKHATVLNKWQVGRMVMHHGYAPDGVIAPRRQGARQAG